MKKSSGRIILVVTLVLSIFMVTNAFADEVIVSGEIYAITTKPNMITICDSDDICEDVYGIKINYLYNQYNIDLQTGVEISVVAKEFDCSDGSIKNMASSITVGDITVTLR